MNKTTSNPVKQLTTTGPIFRCKIYWYQGRLHPWGISVLGKEKSLESEVYEVRKSQFVDLVVLMSSYI